MSPGPAALPGRSGTGDGFAWLTSDRCSAWHAVDRAACGVVVVSACGRPLTGRMSRVLSGPPQDGREVCRDCRAALERCARTAPREEA